MSFITEFYNSIPGWLVAVLTILATIFSIKCFVKSYDATGSAEKGLFVGGILLLLPLAAWVIYVICIAWMGMWGYFHLHPLIFFGIVVLIGLIVIAIYIHDAAATIHNALLVVAKATETKAADNPPPPADPGAPAPHWPRKPTGC